MIPTCKQLTFELGARVKPHLSCKETSTTAMTWLVVHWDLRKLKIEARESVPPAHPAVAWVGVGGPHMGEVNLSGVICQGRETGGRRSQSCHSFFGWHHWLGSIRGMKFLLRLSSHSWMNLRVGISISMVLSNRVFWIFWTHGEVKLTIEPFLSWATHFMSRGVGEVMNFYREVLLPGLIGIESPFDDSTGNDILWACYQLAFTSVQQGVPWGLIIWFSFM